MFLLTVETDPKQHLILSFDGRAQSQELVEIC